MTTRHHRIKTHGGWQVQQPFPGIYIFRDPHGAFYLVDHTGTRRTHGCLKTTTVQAVNAHAPQDAHVDHLRTLSRSRRV